MSPVVHENVHLGEGVELGEFVLIGVPPRGAGSGDLPTVIGPGAIIRSHSVIYAGNRIGARFQAGHGILLRELNEIGDDVSVGTHSIIEHHVVIEHGVRIHSNAFIPEYSVLEEGAWVGPAVVFTNAMYPLGKDAKKTLKGPRIRPRAKVGAHATLLPGVVIGAHALVGAGAVVVDDVPDGVVVVGNPARILKRVSDLSAYEVETLSREHG